MAALLERRSPPSPPSILSLSPPLLLRLLLLVASSAPLFPLAAAAPSLTDDASCGCYRTNGSDVGFFKQHRFFDFRALGSYAGTPDVITSETASAAAPPTSSYFLRDDWSDVWSIQNWNNSGKAREDATVFMVNSPNNVYIESNPDFDARPGSPRTWLTLRTQRLPTFQTAAEIESVETDFRYLSVRMLARTVGAAGACTALFTYREDGGRVQEADLEVLTADPRDVVQYTNQPSVDAAGDVVPKATRNATLPRGLDWSRWAVHRLDWTPARSTWFVDGVPAASIAFQVPRDPSQLILNAWSDGGQWTGNMSVFDEAFLQIQWLDLIYNTTASAAGKKHPKSKAKSAAVCNAVCSLDDTNTTGVPVLLWTTSAAAGLGWGPTAGLASWMPLAAAVVLAYGSFASGTLGG